MTWRCTRVLRLCDSSVVSDTPFVRRGISAYINNTRPITVGVPRATLRRVVTIAPRSFMRVDRGEGQRGRSRLDRHTGRIAIDIMSRRGLASRSCTSRGWHSPVSELFDMWTGPRVGKKKNRMLASITPKKGMLKARRPVPSD